MKKRFKELNFENKVLFWIALVEILLMATLVIVVGTDFRKIYYAFDATLPVASQIALSEYFYLTYVILALILIIKNWLKNETAILGINIAIILFVMFSLFLYIVALYLPVFNLAGLIALII